jgi:hypothetical protein
LATDATRTTFTAAVVLGGAILLDKPLMDRCAEIVAAKILRRLGCRNERVVIGGARSWRWVRG